MYQSLASVSSGVAGSYCGISSSTDAGSLAQQNLRGRGQRQAGGQAASPVRRKRRVIIIGLFLDCGTRARKLGSMQKSAIELGF